MLAEGTCQEWWGGVLLLRVSAAGQGCLPGLTGWGSALEEHRLGAFTGEHGMG